MLIPKCCKGCSNLHKNEFCCCSLPYYCNEWVEDEATDQTKKELENNEYSINTVMEPSIIVRCLICGEETQRLYTVISETQAIDICDKCKQAIMRMREEQNGNK